MQTLAWSGTFLVLSYWIIKSAAPHKRLAPLFWSGWNCVALPLVFLDVAGIQTTDPSHFPEQRETQDGNFASGRPGQETLRPHRDGGPARLPHPNNLALADIHASNGRGLMQRSSIFCVYLMSGGPQILVGCASS